MNRQFRPLSMTEYKTESNSEMVCFVVTFRLSFPSKVLVQYSFLNKFIHAYTIMYRSMDTGCIVNSVHSL